MYSTIIFDLGGVLIDWNPKYLYRTMFDNDEEIDEFLEKVCTLEWNEEQDAGRSLEEGTNELVEKFPEYEEEIRAYYGRWDEMIGDAIEGTVEIFKKLKESKKYKIYALSNWSTETYPIAEKKYPFLSWFDGVVLSGHEKMKKPTHDFYQLLLTRYNVQLDEALFIDDNIRNTDAAEQIGLASIRFTTPEKLQQELAEKGIQLH